MEKQKRKNEAMPEPPNAELHMLLWTLGVFFLMGMLPSLVFVLATHDTVIISVVMGIACAFLPGSLVATCV
ncbi:MAG: hypothetical protein AAFR67_02785, partial [Chloroflexota bacterium]